MLLTSGLPTLGAEAVRGRGAARRAAAAAVAPAPTAARLRRRLVLTAAAPESANPSFDEGRANFADSFERKNEKRPPPTDPAPACDVDGNVDVPLVSECGADYTLLRDLLKSCEWEKADDETRLKMCQLAGEEAEAREWVYFSEVKDIPAADLITIDSLWKSYSKGRFGFSVQRGIWLAEKRKWGALFKRIGWTMGENKAYRKFPNEFLWQADAPKGHLPLTNCLRGTQLFSALLEHPAFGGPLEPLGVRAQGGGMTSIGGFARGGPPPLESLDPGSRAALVLGAIVFLVLGILNSNTNGSF